MKAIRVQEYGGADQLQLDDIAVPEPGPGEALVRQTFAGINFIDVYMRGGIFKRSDTYAQKPPMVIGMEGAGYVEALGDGVDDLALGETVAYCIDLGSYAEYAVVPAWKLVPVPDGVPVTRASSTLVPVGLVRS